MMHKNALWRCFLTAVLLVTLFFSGKAANQLYTFMRLTSLTQPSAEKWSIVPLAEDKFVPNATYTYRVGDTLYQGETLFVGEASYNTPAAESVVRALSAEKHGVWYSPRDPSFSTLQKKFPLKECIYAATLWALSLYFFGLGTYVAKMKSN